MLSSRKITELSNELLLCVPGKDRIGHGYISNLKDKIESINICFVSSISKKNKFPSLNFNLKNYSTFFPRTNILEYIAKYYFEILSNNTTSRSDSSDKFDSTLLYPNPNHDFYRHLDHIISRNIQEIFSGFKVTNLEIVQEVSQGNPILQNFSNHNPIVQNLILNAIKNNFDLNDEVVLQVRDKLLMVKHLEPNYKTHFSRGFQDHIQTPHTPQAKKHLSFSQDRLSLESHNSHEIKNSSSKSILASSTTQNQKPITSSQISSIVIRAKNLDLLRKLTISQDRDELISKNPAIGRQIINQQQILQSRFSSESIFQAGIDFRSPSSSPKTSRTSAILESLKQSPHSSPGQIIAETLTPPRRSLTPSIP
jgi:hypothetical protein